jgi:signal transduction histidine kinase
MAFVPLTMLPWAVSAGTDVSQAFAPVRWLWYSSLSFLALFMALTFGATVYIAQRLVRPVRGLSVAARSVAEGDRAVTIRTPWGGEIGELAQNLEIMRLHLQNWGSELEAQVQVRTSELEERNRELKVLYETLQHKEEQLRVLLGKVLGAQEDERKRVSLELHDGIGQALSAVSMGLERLDRPDQRSNQQEHVEVLKELTMNALSDLRRIVIALRPAALDYLGLVPAIRRYIELQLGNTGVGFQIHEEGPNTRLEPSLETIVYRVVQEAINNVARHSGATRVRIHLRSSEDTLAVTVEDNGQGFDPTLATAKHGVGLQGMEERVSMAGGELTVHSQPGRGTTVHMEIPLSKRISTPTDA